MATLLNQLHWNFAYAKTAPWSNEHEIILHHDDVIKWKHFPRYWTFVRGIHKGK